MLRFGCLLIGFVLFITKSQCQTISGKVKSIGTETPLQNVTVTLYQAFNNVDSAIYKEIFTDSAGRYVLENNTPGHYKLHFSHVNSLIKIFEINLFQDTVINIYLLPSIAQLEAVKVIGQKPVIERKVDRIVFNVQNSILNKGVSAIDILRETPRIEVVGDDGIKMIGKSEVKVMIDGKILNLSSEDIKIKLRSLRSDDISAIEVIPIPPARYSAEGNSGLINIILKKDPLLGWQGSLNLDYTQRVYSSFAQSLGLNYRSKNISTSLTIANYSSIILNENNLDFLISQNTVNSRRHIYNTARMPLFSANVEYTPAKKMKLGGNFYINRSKAKNNNNEVVDYVSKGYIVADSIVSSLSRTDSKRKSISSSAYIDLYLDADNKKKLTFTYNYSLNTAPIIREVESTIFKPNDNSFTPKDFTYDGDNHYRINSWFLDLYLPFSFATVEGGAAYTFIDNSTGLKLYNIVSGQPIPDPSGTNDFNYSEKTPAIYASINKQITKKWSTKIGLRYEYSIIEGISPTLHLKNTTSYGKLFPSIFFLFLPTHKNSLSLSYSRRINRPNFNDLNPFKFYYGAYSYSSGNAYLSPSFTHNLELNYIYKNNLSIVLYYSHLVNGVGGVTLANDGIISTVPENYYTRDRLGLDISYRYNAFPWWSLYFSGNAYLDNSRSTVPAFQIVDNKGAGSSLRLQNTFNLSKAKNSLVLVTYNQTLPSIDGFYKTKGFGTLSASYRYTLPNGKFSVLLQGYDIFNQNRLVRTIKYETGYLKSTIIPRVQSFSFSVSYNFGNKNVKSSERGYKIDRGRAL
jgi:hypothetical protein